MKQRSLCLMKKFLAALLSCALLLSLCAPAFARVGNYTSIYDITDEDYLREDFHSINDYGYLFGFGEPGTWEIYESYEQSDTFPEDLTALMPSGHYVPYKYPSTSITSLELPKSLVILDGSFESYSNSGYRKLTSVNFEELTNLKYIGGYFQCTPLQTIDLRNTQVVRIAGEGTFSTNNRLSAFYAPSTLRRIDDGVFHDCPNLSLLQLNEGLEYIGARNFGTNTMTTYLEYTWTRIPSTVTYIGAGGLPTKYTFWSNTTSSYSTVTAQYEVYKGTYAEEWCKANGVTYRYVTDWNKIANPPYNPREKAPTLTNTQKVGDLLFSGVAEAVTNYMVYEDGTKVPYSYRVTLVPGGCVQTTENGATLIYDYNGSRSYERTSAQPDLLMRDFIRPYLTAAYGSGYEKGLTWKFEGDYNRLDTGSTHGYWQLYNLYVENAASERSARYSITVSEDAEEQAPPPATATSYSILVDGKTVAFDAYALKDANGNDTNYLKLRDVAHVLNGSASQFNVGWDGSAKAISITTKTAYTSPNGSEMSTPFSGDQPYKQNSARVMVNGVPANLEAITITDAGGNGYTYFKLRDLGTALGFGVDWDGSRGVIVINPNP